MDFEIDKILNKLSNEREIFYSEADFQHALAWKIHQIYPEIKIRLEYPISVNGSIYYVDIFLKYNSKCVGIELKYKTKKIECVHKKEKFLLKNQGAQDLGRYDYLWDVYRLEQIKEGRKNFTGYAIFITNDYLYWKDPTHKDTIDKMFRIHQGKEINSRLSWTEKASEGSKRGREEDIFIKNTYRINWEKYSKLNGHKYDLFKYLLLII